MISCRVKLRSTASPAVRCAAGSDDQIGGLKTVYCDDFQCDSSPQVERAIRAFAKDVERHTTWTLPIFAEDAVYMVRRAEPLSHSETQVFAA
jgi:hypothetical protein